MKRQRSAGNSPVIQGKKQRTFADVVSDDLRVMILDKNSAMNWGKLEKVLHEQLDGYLATSPRKSPTFHDYKYNGENLRLICADEFSKNGYKR